jgi:alkylation response protein AidB-like acyl-CoA dehydrogenase
MRIDEGFQQPPFDDTANPYSTDPVLPNLLRRLIPDARIREEVAQDLSRLGDKLVQDIRPLAPLVHQSSLTQYDHWGRRVDDLKTSEGWRKLEAFAVSEGYISIPYERKYAELSRVYAFLKVMVMTGDCHVIMCPMGMTDGGARTLEMYGTEQMKRELLPKLISSDPQRSYLSGQWMTERPGGSDLSLAETTATPASALPGVTDLGVPYTLNGFKWFSSAAEGNMSVALARTGSLSEGSRGLSLFVIPLRHGAYPTPLSNGVKMHRLKNKIGTHGVPTAELELHQTRGWLVGGLGQGVKSVATILNITRVHSAVHLVGSLQRCLAIARAYAQVRTINAGRTKLADTPLHVATLADATLLYTALTHLSFGAVELLGKSECGLASESEEMRLRLLTPAIKAYASVKCPTAMEEMMGSLGGLGYMEEIGIGRLIRDALVERIWEGAVNILALDLVRALKKEGTLECYMEWCQQIISSVSRDSPLAATADKLDQLLRSLRGYLADIGLHPLLPRPVLNYFASISCAMYLLQHALWAIKEDTATQAVDVEAVRRWVDEGDVHSYAKEIASITGQDHAQRVRLNLEMVYGPTPAARL